MKYENEKCAFCGQFHNYVPNKEMKHYSTIEIVLQTLGKISNEKRK